MNTFEIQPEVEFSIADVFHVPASSDALKLAREDVASCCAIVFVQRHERDGAAAVLPFTSIDPRHRGRGQTDRRLRCDEEQVGILGFMDSGSAQIEPGE